MHFVFATLLYLVASSIAAAGDANDAVPKKLYVYGQYVTLTCHRVENAGRFPTSYSQHEVTAINGQAVATPFRTHVEYIDHFDIPGNSEVTISGYFTQKEIGSPIWPENSPERHYMQVQQFPFHFV